jgi:hypothetical protein
MLPKTQKAHGLACAFVREGGIEPPQPNGHQALNLARLPIPPFSRSEPLGYGTVDVHLGKRRETVNKKIDHTLFF